MQSSEKIFVFIERAKGAALFVFFLPLLEAAVNGATLGRGGDTDRDGMGFEFLGRHSG